MSRFLALLLFILNGSVLVGFPTDIAHAKRSPAQARKDLELYVGKDYFEAVNNLEDTPSLRGNYKKYLKVAYSPETKQIRITPLSPGTSTLTLHDSKGQLIQEYLISVTKTDLTRISKEIAALLTEIEGIQIKVLNGKVVVDGEVLLPKDINRVHSVVSQYGDQLATNLVRLSPIAQKKIAEFIERDINNPEIHVRSVNETFILEGVAADEVERNRAEIIAKTYVPDIVSKNAPGVKKYAKAPVVNLISLRAAAAPEPEKMVQLIAYYVELKKDYTSGFRFQWTPDLSDDSQLKYESGSRSPGNILTSITGTVSNLLPKLNWAKQHGHARVLQSSSVIVQNNQPGTISSMTRIPYQVLSAQGIPSTNFQEAGINANIHPTIVSASSDSVQLKITIQISSLLGITDQGPIISSNNINTVVTVRSGQSAAIGGLVSNSSGTGYNKLPKSVGSNPLFSLYASKDFRRDQSQFVVFVTPYIKSSASAGSEAIKKKFRLRD